MCDFADNVSKQQEKHQKKQQFEVNRQLTKDFTNVMKPELAVEQTVQKQNTVNFEQINFENFTEKNMSEQPIQKQNFDMLGMSKFAVKQANKEKAEGNAKGKKKSLNKQFVVAGEKEVSITNEFKVWKSGETDTIERNLPEMSERAKMLFGRVSMKESEESSLWETMGKSFMRNKIKLMNSLWNGRDSAEMKAVKVALDKLSGFYQTGIGNYFADVVANPETGQVDRISLEKAKTNALEAYNALVMDVITSAEHYLRVKNPITSSGVARYNNVKQLKEQLENEKDAFEEALRFLVTHVTEKNITGEEADLNEVKFADVLRIVKAERYDFSEAGGGGGNTFSFIDANQEKKYFKTNEKIVEVDRFPEYFREMLEKETKEAKPEDAALYKKFISAWDKFDVHFKKAEQDFCKLVNAQTVQEAVEKIEAENDSQYNRSRNDQAIINRYSALRNHRVELVSVLCMKAGSTIESRKRLKKCQNKLRSSKGDELTAVIDSINELRNQIGSKLTDKYHSTIFTSGCAKVNGIDENCVVTMRSIATSRLADEITKRADGDADYTEAIVGARTSLIKTEKGYKSGIVMDEAKGSPAGNVLMLAAEKEKPVIFTTKAAKQYNFIMIFDFICGQMDRHAGNFMMDYKETAEGFVVSSVQAIDNDYSFGRFNSDKLKKGRNRLSPIVDKFGGFSFKYIDKKLEDAIMKLDDSFISLIKQQFADCQITDEQFKAMEDRIAFLKNLIADGIKDGKVKIIETEDEWQNLTMGNIISKTSADAVKRPMNMSDYIYFGNSDKKKIRAAG